MASIVLMQNLQYLHTAAMTIFQWDMPCLSYYVWAHTGVLDHFIIVCSQLVIMITSTSNIVCVLQEKLSDARETEQTLNDQLRQYRDRLRTTEVLYS